MSISSKPDPAADRVTEFLSRSPEQTEAEGARLFRDVLRPGSVIALYGDLGAGKTCLVRGIARGLRLRDPVTSPSFDLVHEYRGELPFHHVDLFRVNSIGEAEELDLEERFRGGGVTAIEWAERAEELLPADAIRVRLEETVEPEVRRIRIEWGRGP